MTNEGPPRKKRPSSTLLGISRSIAACQRCRVKKVRCDQNFPKCSKCAKAGLECVGIDPATGREVPRSYVYFLEDKIQFLEEKLKMHGIDPDVDTPQSIKLDPEELPILPSSVVANEPENEPLETGQLYLGASLGVSFAKLMMTAVKMNNLLRPFRQDPLELTAGQDDVRAAILPPKSTAQEFIRIFFAQSNAQLPILHREYFLKNVFVPIYGAWDERVPLASKYTAINTALYSECIPPEEETWFFQYKKILSQELAKSKQDTASISDGIKVPKQFHKPLFFLNIIFAISSSVNHLQYLNSISDLFKAAALKFIDSTYATSDPLEQLEAVLLLLLFSTMRPNVPGVWYILGQGLRICVDLGLHNDGFARSLKFDAFTKDRRRRLFWCTYSLDRQICFYLGRPVGISDESITTRLPSEMDDAFITASDSTEDYSDYSGSMPTYKTISLLFFRIRQIQLEVQHILYENGELPRKFDNLAQWKTHISLELETWRSSTPRTQLKMNCDFNLEFFTLNYNHTLLLINGLSPKTFKLSLDSYHKVLEALKNLMACYTQLYLKKAINYTWAAVYNLFMAGTSYLFVLYNSADIRRHNSIFEVKKITEECLSVLTLLMASCDAARSCRDTFQVLTAAVLKLRYNEIVEGATLGIVEPPNAVKELLDGRNNGNLANLVEGLAEESEDPHVLDLPRFEWISRKSSSSEEAVQEGTPMQETDLDNFFVELENLSPVLSVRDFSEASSAGGLMLESGTEQKVPSKDGKRVFELIQQLPTESIWDQFFTIPKGAVKQEPSSSVRLSNGVKEELGSSAKEG